MTVHQFPERELDVDEELAQLRIRCEQLQHALESRVVIEQAKGILAERYGCSTDRAFEALRSAARSTQRKLHDLASEVVSSRETPPSIRPDADGRSAG